jgi:DNA (cytosine-5)-methyltransferase 1
MPRHRSTQLPVIDLFAGPGGLGEGFASLEGANARKPFRLAISIEMEHWAHSTLQFRAFMRRLDRPLTDEEWRLAAERTSGPAQLMERFPREAAEARNEARQGVLGRDDPAVIGRLIASAIADRDDAVLIGGPPCQAYSLVGRSRNRGKAGYVPELDHRQTLYVEYLQILADHGPAIFIMENVKGLRSAALHDQPLLGRILDDLSFPTTAIRREGRQTAGRGRRYDIYSLNPSDNLWGASSDFVLRAENFGVPQARHRVILVGVRGDLGVRPASLLTSSWVGVRSAIGDLPPVRSAVSGGDGSAAEWRQTLRAIESRGWLDRTDNKVRRRIAQRLRQVRAPHTGIGNNITERDGRDAPRFPWLRAERVPFILNHQARSHMPSDLERYFFAACWAEAHGRSPALADFPTKLLPAHRNVARALSGGLFADRFRVQLPDRPSTTITSHISKDGHYFIHPDPRQCRSLTVREAARLQTFPDDYLFTGPRTAQYQQVGNAVPPHMARQIAACIAEALGIH